MSAGCLHAAWGHDGQTHWHCLFCGLVSEVDPKRAVELVIELREQLEKARAERDAATARLHQLHKGIDVNAAGGQ